MPNLPAPGQSIHEHRLATRKMRWWYEHLADYMLAHPSARQNEIALYFGRTAATISTIINTDAFKAYLRKRREEYAGALDAQVRDKLLNVADRGLDFLLESLEKKRDSIPIEVLQKTVESSLKNLGYGQEKSAPVVQVNTAPSVNVSVGLDDLEQARAALRASQKPQTALPGNATEGRGTPLHDPDLSQPDVEVE